MTSPTQHPLWPAFVAHYQQANGLRPHPGEASGPYSVQGSAWQAFQAGAAASGSDLQTLAAALRLSVLGHSVPGRCSVGQDELDALLTAISALCGQPDRVSIGRRLDS